MKTCGLDVHKDSIFCALYNEQQTEQCLTQMRRIYKEYYSKEMELAKSIPGVSEISAMIILT